MGCRLLSQETKKGHRPNGKQSKDKPLVQGIHTREEFRETDWRDEKALGKAGVREWQKINELNFIILHVTFPVSGIVSI